MPGGDRTGPRGLGPATGWGFGPCGSGMKKGFGRGFGRGYRWRRIAANQNAEETNEQEIAFLEDESKLIEHEQELLRQELENIKKKIEEFKKKNKRSG